MSKSTPKPKRPTLTPKQAAYIHVECAAHYEFGISGKERESYYRENRLCDEVAQWIEAAKSDGESKSTTPTPKPKCPKCGASVFGLKHKPCANRATYIVELWCHGCGWTRRLYENQALAALLPLVTKGAKNAKAR